jgi:hypothetical protein
MSIMKSKQLAGYLFSALMLTCFQQGTAQTTYNGSVAKPQGQQQMRQDQMGMAPKCDNQGNWDFWADFLWWSSNLNSLTGFEAEVNATTTDEDVSLHFKRPGSHWDPGVRVGAGWNTGYDNWDVQGYWTYFYNSSKKGENPASFEFNEVQEIYHEGSAKLRLRYNAADFEIGKAYYVSRHFFIRPFTGLHAIWTSLDNSFDFESESSASPTLPIITNGLIGAAALSLDSSGETDADLSQTIEAWGVGPRIGVNTNWGDFRGFSLLGNISGALVYGKLLGKAKIDIDSLVDIDVHIRDHEYWQVMPTMQIQWGLSYSCCFGQGQNQFRMSAAWESNFIWEAGNQFFNDKPISMQGLTVDLRFDF